MAADTVTTRVLNNGPRNYVARFTNYSQDGAGEADVVKLDATDTAIGYKGIANGIYWQVKRIDYIIRSGGLRLLWEATADETLAMLNGEGFLDYSQRGGIPVPAIAGVTGSIGFTTIGFMINSGYDVTIHMTKGVPQV